MGYSTYQLVTGAGFLLSTVARHSVRQDHADFKRKGADLFIERKISLVEVTIWMLTVGAKKLSGFQDPKKTGKKYYFWRNTSVPWDNFCFFWVN